MIIQELQQPRPLLQASRTIRSSHVLTTLRKRWVEWTLALTLVVIGVVMVYSGDRMTSDRYDQLTKVAPSSMWALVTFLTGFVRMAILYMNGRWHPSYMGRVVTAIMSMALWYNFALLAWVNLDNVLVVTFPLSLLPILLEGLAVVFALHERGKALSGLLFFFPNE